MSSLRPPFLLIFLLLGFACITAIPTGNIALSPALADPPAADVPAHAGRWSATGTLLESCTCAVPCTCNFGQGPSPQPYCHAIFGYRLEKASWDGADLSGLIVAGADGPKGAIGFLDSRATPAQRPALEKLGRALFAQGGPAGGKRRFVPAAITHEAKGNRLRFEIAGYGSFNANVLIGRDGVSPVVVENNTVWPIPRAIKAKADKLTYKDEDGAGTIQADGNNANYGSFSFLDKAIPPGERKTAPQAQPGCCGSAVAPARRASSSR